MKKRKSKKILKRMLKNIVEIIIRTQLVAALHQSALSKFSEGGIIVTPNCGEDFIPVLKEKLPDNVKISEGKMEIRV